MKPSRTAPAKTPGGILQPVRIGFVPVTDCAPLLAARALGLFARHGVMVELSCEVGWATVREKLRYRQLDAAHAIAGLALSLRMGLQTPAVPVRAPFVFSLHGNAITLSRDLRNRGVRDAASLGKLARSQPGRRLTFAVVSALSSHAFLLRSWLSNAGLHDHVHTVVLPPTQMASSMAAGLIDGFCVGEPWNSVAVAAGTGWVAATSEQLAPGHPEKVLLMSEQFAAENADAARAVVAALREACAFCDAPEHRAETVAILTESGCFAQPSPILARSLVGPIDAGTGEPLPVERFHIFHRDDANEPTPARGAWLLRQFIAQGLIPESRRDEARAALDAAWAPLPDSPTAPRQSRRSTTTRPLQTA